MTSAPSAGQFLLWISLEATHTLRNGLILESAQNVVGQMVADFTMPRHGLTRPRSWILIPVGPPSMSKQGAATLFEAPNQVGPFHAIRSSATRRTPGIRPLVSSS